jgi:hypothetical protein
MLVGDDALFDNIRDDVDDIAKETKGERFALAFLARLRP